MSSIYIGVLFAGCICMFYTKTLYLGLILVWAMPVCLLQWFVGQSYLVANKKVLVKACLMSTFYLWLVDGYAIYKGVWTITDETIIGWALFDILPLEEAVFFLVTNKSDNSNSKCVKLTCFF